MIRLIDKAVPWIHPRERPSEGAPNPDATVFWIKGMTEGLSRRLRGVVFAAEKKENALDDLNRFYVDMFMSCVTEIENVQLPGETQPRVLKSDGDKRLFLDAVPAEYMGEVYKAIQNLSALDRGTRKN